MQRASVDRDSGSTTSASLTHDNDPEALDHFLETQHEAFAAIAVGTRAISCGFCGKAQNEVKKIIAGPNVYICDECVSLCAEILADET